MPCGSCRYLPNGVDTEKFNVDPYVTKRYLQQTVPSLLHDHCSPCALNGANYWT